MVANGIQQRREQAFLPAWTTNEAAISLCERLGFGSRTQVQAAVLQRSG
ncbi:MAG: hypothetical protein H0W24_04045 [Lysobacter sp.]|nr:hypothetical protein [Lysobacter sp.]